MQVERKVRQALAHKKWAAKFPGSFDIFKRYGITQDDYSYLLKKQNGVCAICGKVPSRKSRRKRLSVDHNHKTKDIRGLLCNLCNMWLGRIEDNPEAVLRAFAYLRRLKCPSMNLFVELVTKNLIELNLSELNASSNAPVNAVVSEI